MKREHVVRVAKESATRMDAPKLRMGKVEASQSFAERPLMCVEGPFRCVGGSD